MPTALADFVYYASSRVLGITNNNLLLLGLLSLLFFTSGKYPELAVQVKLGQQQQQLVAPFYCFLAFVQRIEFKLQLCVKSSSFMRKVAYYILFHKMFHNIKKSILCEILRKFSWFYYYYRMANNGQRHVQCISTLMHTTIYTEEDFLIFYNSPPKNARLF